MGTAERDCNSCARHKQAHRVPELCQDCLSFFTLIHWKPMSKSYDAAWRDDNTLPPIIFPVPKKESSDGSTAGYYTLPKGATELQDLISHKDMNAQMGEIFRAVYRFGEVSHSPKIRDIKKIIFYAHEELKRLEKLA